MAIIRIEHDGQFTWASVVYTGIHTEPSDEIPGLGTVNHRLKVIPNLFGNAILRSTVSVIPGIEKEFRKILLDHYDSSATIRTRGKVVVFKRIIGPSPSHN